MAISFRFNPFTGKFDMVSVESLANYSFISQNTVEVLTGCTEVAGKRYASIADAITYIATQTPAANNIWGISCLDKTNAENFTVPDYVMIYSPKGFAGVLGTNFSGNITLGNYSMLNSVKTTGQVTIGADNSGTPALFYAAYIGGTLVCAASTYAQSLYSLIYTPTGFALAGTWTSIVGDVVIATAITVETGGSWSGAPTLYSSTITSTGGTITANSYGQFYDNTASGLTADTVGDAIDEVQGNIPIITLTAGTGISISGTYPDFTITNDDPDQTVALTQGTNITITGTYPNFTINATDTSLWQTGTSGAELKTADDIYLKANKRFIF